MNLVVPFRFAFFGTFVVCNAILCSAAAWNLGIAQMIGHRLDVDGYLAFLGAFDLVFVVVISVIDLTRKNPVTSRVWFECTWLVLSLVLHTCGAAVLTALGPELMCQSQVAEQVSDACVSLRLTLATSWACLMSSLVYLMVLGVSACLRHYEDRTVWQAPVRDYCWDKLCIKLPNVDPVIPQQVKRISIKAPRPRRAELPNLYLRDSRLGTVYDVEQPVPPVPALPAQPLMRQVTRGGVQPSSLYAKYLPPLQPAAPAVEGRPTPPPLGDWPRTNIINEPIRKKRRPAPAIPKAVPASSSVPASSLAPSAPEPAPYSAPRPNLEPVYIPAPTSKPAGPRTIASQGTKKPNGDWRKRVPVPPPLDLSKISTNRPRSRE